MEKGIFLPVSLQVLLGFLLLFRTSLPWYLRVLVFLYSAFGLWFWYPELYQSMVDFTKENIVPYLKQNLAVLYTALLWLWPTSLLYIAYMASDKDAKITLYILFGLTLIAQVHWFLP